MDRPELPSMLDRRDDLKGTEANFGEAYNIIRDMFGYVEEEPPMFNISIDEINRLISH